MLTTAYASFVTNACHQATVQYTTQPSKAWHDKVADFLKKGAMPCTCAEHMLKQDRVQHSTPSKHVLTACNCDYTSTV
jgi:hypothetical protein